MLMANIFDNLFLMSIRNYTSYYIFITHTKSKDISNITLCCTLSNKNKEVLVRIAYNSNMAKKAAKKAIKDDLEKKGDELHNKLDELLGW
jgi:hypothetical protein